MNSIAGRTCRIGSAASLPFPFGRVKSAVGWQPAAAAEADSSHLSLCFTGAQVSALVAVGHRCWPKRHRLALATDGGVFTAEAGQGSHTSWSRLGAGLPNAAVDDLTVGPDNYIYAATHGRGVWRIRL